MSVACGPAPIRESVNAAAFMRYPWRVETELAQINQAVDQLVDEYRTRYLWSLRTDYFPRTRSEQLRVLATIRQHGDLEAFRRASSLSQWLLQRSNAASVAR